MAPQAWFVIPRYSGILRRPGYSTPAGTTVTQGMLVTLLWELFPWCSLHSIGAVSGTADHDLLP